MERWINSLLGLSWEEYVTSLTMDQRIQAAVTGVGVLLLLCTASLAGPGKIRQLGAGIGGMLVLLWAVAVSKSGHPFWAQLLERTIAMGTPWLALAVWRYGLTANLFLLARLAVAGTFIGHGLFAAHLLPCPGHFVDMGMNSTGLQEQPARIFLRIAGYLDFVASALLFLPLRFARWGALYMVFWGFATTSARLLAHRPPMGDWSNLLEYWSLEALYRFPHFLVPLSLVFWIHARITSPGYRPSGSGLYPNSSSG